MILFLLITAMSQLYTLEPVCSGVASWYSTDECPGITASGEPMRDDAYACATYCADIGDVLLVVSDRGAVVVRCNDRGPYVDGRVVDLTRPAFKQMADLDDGLARVRIWRISTNADH